MNQNTAAPSAEFGELPPNPLLGATSPAWAKVATDLRARPAEWAKVITKKGQRQAAVFAGGIKRGTPNAFKPPGSFDAVSRGADVWARYIGPAVSE